MRNFRWTLEGSGMEENSHQHWFIWCPRRWNAKIVISKMLRSTAAVDDPAFYAHHIKCPRSEFIHEKSSWIVQRQKEHRRNPFTGRLSRGGLDSHSASFLLYFIVSFSDHFDEFYRWQFVSIFCWRQLSPLIVLTSEIPFFSIFLRLQNVLRILFSYFN